MISERLCPPTRQPDEKKMAAPIQVRTLTSVEDCRRLQAVQGRVWGGGPDDIIPIHVLVTQSKNGGLLQGAFASSGAHETGGMVGFSFGWPAFERDSTGERRLKFCSHIAGVLPEWIGRGIGLQLKISQREELLRQGWTDWVTWTYDPLQRVNARLNIPRLGGISDTYVRNVYGEMQDSLNAGMPTDRFRVDWYLNSPRVQKALGISRRPPETAPPLQTEERDARPARGVEKRWPTADLQRARTRPLPVNPDLRAPLAPPPAPDGRPYALPLPDNVDALRRGGDTLLFDWRIYVRQAAEGCFAACYALVDCILIEDEWHYIFALRD